MNRRSPYEFVDTVPRDCLDPAARKQADRDCRVSAALRDQGQPERAAILRTVCRMSESDFNQYSMHSTFTGQVQTAPKLLSSGAGVRKFVFNVPGAIGYIRAGEVDRSVKAVRLDGRLPGEGGYKLRLEPR